MPFPHGNESGTLDFNEVFRHSLLLKVFVCIIGGVAAATKVMEKHARLPKMQCSACSILNTHLLAQLPALPSGPSVSTKMGPGLVPLLGRSSFPETNGAKFSGVQADDESVREELAAATNALVNMAVVSDV
ncbi:hypothetical protein B0H19DRAFT_1068736 [Mycena capillaripes]|nr:hypothetical protein B0H19DRAFT_1068736 [Mycena capillaripes]